MEVVNLQPKTNKSLLIAGLILAVIGISLNVVMAFPVADSVVWFDQTFQVPGFNYYYVYGEFSSDVTMHIYFDLTGDGVLDFWVLDEVEYQEFSAGRQFDYFTAPSAPSVAGKDVLWTPPNSRIYFVWDNSVLPNSQTVYALFKLEGQKLALPPIIVFLGLPLLFTGLALGSIGFHPLTQSRGTVIVGYIFAVLGGVIGVILGIGLITRETTEEKFHGKMILAIGFLAILLYIVLYYV